MIAEQEEPEAERARADEADEFAEADASAVTVVSPAGAIGRAGLAAATVVGLDQLTKWWALRSLQDGLIDVGIFDFRLIYNTGASFGLGNEYGAVIGVIALIVAVGLMLFARTIPRRLGQVLLGLIAGGAIGNVLDRLFRGNPMGTDGFMRGAVVDFIDFRWWPVFNVADMAVVCGAILLVLISMRED